MHDKFLALLIKVGALITILVITGILYLFLIEMPKQDTRHKAYVACLDVAYNNVLKIGVTDYTDDHYHKLVSDCMIGNGYLNGRLLAD